MLTDLATADQISRVISQATAPAFLLGAVAAFISVLITRMNRLADRSNALIAIPDDDPRWAHLKVVLPRLSQRARLINRAIEFAVISGIFTTGLVILAFFKCLLEIPTRIRRRHHVHHGFDVVRCRLDYLVARSARGAQGYRVPRMSCTT